MSEMTKEISKATKIFLELEVEYKKFRKSVGSIAAKYGENPYEILIKFLDASIKDETIHYKEAKGKVSNIPAIIAEALGVKLEDLGNMELGPKELKKIIDAMDAASDDDDEDDDDELDF